MDVKIDITFKKMELQDKFREIYQALSYTDAPGWVYNVLDCIESDVLTLCNQVEEQE